MGRKNTSPRGRRHQSDQEDQELNLEALAQSLVDRGLAEKAITENYREVLTSDKEQK